jgi:phospholipid-translocating ATPase
VIGDGSNDVNMITVADVGISIRGVEGNDVTRVSDFVIGQFSLLAPLVLYYGREWYRKNAKFVNFSMMKNIYHVAGVVGFGGFSMFGALVIY